MKICRTMLTGIIAFGMLVGISRPAFSQNGTSQATKSTADTSKKTSGSKASTTAPSAADIQAAKTAGKVWVNTETKVYHKDGKYYGNTKKGKFMTEADAKQAGFRAAKGD
jgi:hypothetical protein